MWLDTRWLAVSIVALSLGTALASEPSLGLSDDGTVILYRAEAGDLPGVIAERFGIAPTDLRRFSPPTASATRRGFRAVTSPHSQSAAARAAEAEARAGGLTTDLASARRRGRGPHDAGDDARGTQRRAHAPHDPSRAPRPDLAVGTSRRHRARPRGRRGRLRRLPVGDATAGDRALRARASRRPARTERRRGALAERQAASRRELDLESALRDREHELASYRPARARPTGTH